MYNAEMKESFLNTIENENSYKAYIRAFKLTEEIETFLSKDVCEMSVNDIMSLLDLKTGARKVTAIQTMSLLKTYVDWCLQNGKIVGENNFDKISYEKINQSRAIFEQYVKDEEEFDEMCKSVYKQTSDYIESIEKPKELIVRLAFLELSIDEIVVLKKTDIDYENGIIQSPLYPLQYHATKRILYLCEYCANQKIAAYKNRDYEEAICDNDYLIRSRASTMRKDKSEKDPIHIQRCSRAIKDFSTRYYEETEIYKKTTPKTLSDNHMLIRIRESSNPTKFIETEIKSEICKRNPDIKEAALKQRIYSIKKLYNTWRDVYY